MNRSDEITLVACIKCGVKFDVLTGYNRMCFRCAKKEKYDKMDRDEKQKREIKE